jgi:hypothetical protein
LIGADFSPAFEMLLDFLDRFAFGFGQEGRGSQKTHNGATRKEEEHHGTMLAHAGQEDRRNDGIRD